MTNTPEWACWLDLETAGSNETLDPILEVGAVLCRNEPGMPIEHEWSWLVLPPEGFEVLEVAPFVREMHEVCDEEPDE